MRQKINVINFVNVKVQIIEIQRQKGEKEFKVRGLILSHKKRAKDTELMALEVKVSV